MSFDNKQLKDATDFLWDLYASSLSADETEPDFSPEFLQKMEHLQRKYRMQKVWKTAARFAAILLLALALTGGAILTFSTDARAAFHSWFREITATGARYHFLNEPDETLMEYYKIEDIPEGYELLYVESGQNIHLMRYERNDGKKLIFSYNTIQAGDSSLIISDYCQKCAVNGQPAEYYYEDEEGTNSILLWRDEKAKMIFQLDGFLAMNEMVSLAECVIPSTRPQPVYQITMEGYEFQREFRGSEVCGKEYKSSDATVTLLYCKMSAASTYIAINQYHTQTTVNGLPADYYYNCNGTAADLVWIDEDANLIFGLSAIMDMEQMVAIAESVTLQE